MAAINSMRAWQRGQSSTSMPKLRRISTLQASLRSRVGSSGPPSSRGRGGGATALGAYIKMVQKKYNPKDGLFDKGNFGGDAKTHRPTLNSQASLVELFALQKQFAAALSG
jgi:hypothetical protein